MIDTSLPLGVCVFPEFGPNRARTVSYPGYLEEILAHTGVFHQRVAMEQLQSALASLKILVTVGEVELPEALKRTLADWVTSGGAWISIAGVCGMEQTLGAAIQKADMWSWGGGAFKSLGEGYLINEKPEHPIVAHVTRMIHLFGGTTVTATSGQVLARVDDKHGRKTDRAGIIENVAGKGRTILIAPDLTGTVVRIQQGLCVTRDGVPAPDGSGPVNDSVLKADDGCVLDWDFDRDAVPGMNNFRCYLEPMADVWREILLRSIFHVATQQRVELPVLWLYPRQLPALAHMSHDTDGNEPPKAHRLIELLDEAKIKATWCVILPGYEPAIINKIKSAGHELATHYDAMTEGTSFSQKEFNEQWRHLIEMFGEKPVTNKNHYTRWEGDTEFFEWCAARGIQMDQSKGASKTGEAGYNFGTCHLYFPVTFRGKPIDVLEMCLPTQDLHVFAPVELFETLLATVKKHHGVFHQLYHPAHTSKPEVGESLLMVARRAREEGMEWWTAKEINRWERARRTVRVVRWEGGKLTLHAGERLEDATVLMLSSKNGRKQMNAWGFSFDAVTQTIEAEKDVSVSF
ncbi:MAG TPA: hypothetical protein VF669_00035 [Tepidisphaeraceae bacterium]|jgi:hypothetical protein